MAANPGMLTTDELSQRASAGEIDTVFVGFTDLYGRLVGKRFDAGFFLESAAQHGAHACDYLLTVDMEMEPVPGYRFANWEKGYGDVHMVPDLATMRVATWLDRTAIVQCDVYDAESHQLVDIAPRSLLGRQVEKLSTGGYSAKAGSELEYYLFEDSYREAAAQGHRGMQASGWYLEDYHSLQGARTEPFHGELRRHLAKSGVPVETSKGEWGVGQHELNVRYAEIMEMADRHCIYKQCAKELADQMGMSVTFMAKLAEDQAGSSCHVHVSLWSGDDNAFHGDKKLGPVHCSDAFRWFLGGWIARAPEVMPFYAPNPNSYKRYRSGSWAPTKLAWSYDNRTAGFRVVGSEKSLRIECRVPGADCNPYLVYAAALASGMDGMANQTEPPDIFVGDVYAAEELPGVPSSLREATDNFAQSEFAKAAFGEAVVEHYTHFFRTEDEAHAVAVSDWERKRYFEQI